MNAFDISKWPEPHIPLYSGSKSYDWETPDIEARISALEKKLKDLEHSVDVVDNRLEGARSVVPYLVVAGLVSAVVLVYLYVSYKSDDSNSESEKKE
jgi:hypothetical protein